MDDLISRSKLIEDLESFKVTLGDIIFRWLVDRVIERVRQQPAAKETPKRQPTIDRCVCCGEIVPEGRMVCPKCEREGDDGKDRV